MKRQFILAIAVCFTVLVFSKSAHAHVTMNPDTSEPGSYEKYDVRVPVEKEANTTKIELKVPKGVNVVGVAPQETFDHKLTKDDETADMKTNVTYNKLNKIDEIKIPDEAKDAKKIEDLQGGSSSSSSSSSSNSSDKAS